MASVQERVGILETKVEVVNEKIDDIKLDIKDVHMVLEKNKEELKEQLDKMYDASCEQHAMLAKKISTIEGLKEKWTYIAFGAVAAVGVLTGNFEKILSLIT